MIGMIYINAQWLNRWFIKCCEVGWIWCLDELSDLDVIHFGNGDESHIEWIGC